jgi:four helix bundle protein
MNSKKKTTGFTELIVYQLAAKLGDQIWNIVLPWNGFSRDTIGKQLVKAVDSVGANIAERAGRGSYQDNRRFITMARGSFYETRHWLRRAQHRQLLTPPQVAEIKVILDELGPRLNAHLNSIGSTKNPMLKDK